MTRCISRYLAIYEKMREEIIKGAYTYGEKLPSKRVTADQTNCSVITVAHAYELLIDEGYVEAREKSGYYVSYKTENFYDTRKNDAEITYANAQGPYMHGAGEVSYNTFAKTMRKTLLDYGERILERMPNQGVYELRYEISRYLARSIGIEVSWEQIIIGAGAEYLYGLIAQLFSEHKSVAVENPCYDKIKKVYSRFGLSVDELELGQEGILSTELSKTNARLLHVTPFHSYPSNVTASISKKNEYIDWSKDEKIIIEDNYDSELAVSRKMENTLYSLSPYHNVIYLNSFSKTISPALRVGYMVLPKEMLDEFEKRLGFYSCTVPAFEQYVLCELIRSGNFERHLNKARRKIKLDLNE